MSPWPGVIALVLIVGLSLMLIWSAHIPVLRDLFNAAPLEKEEKIMAKKCPEHKTIMQEIGGPGNGQVMYNCTDCADRHVALEIPGSQLKAQEDQKHARAFGGWFNKGKRN